MRARQIIVAGLSGGCAVGAVLSLAFGAPNTPWLPLWALTVASTALLVSWIISPALQAAQEDQDA